MTNKYANGKIYKIESDETNDVYYGSTTQKLSQRMAGHRSDYKRYKEGKFSFVTSFEILKYDDAKIYLVETFPCNSREELEARERHWIKNSDCVNRIQPGRTDKQYYEDNKEIISQKHKQYREDNADKIKESNKQYKQDNKDKISASGKQYRESKKEAIKQKNHDYKVQRVICECGADVSRHSLTRHKTRSLHTENMAKLTVTPL